MRRPKFQSISCEFCDIFKNSFLAEQLQATVSGSAHVFLLRHLYEISYNQNLKNSEKEV